MHTFTHGSHSPQVKINSNVLSITHTLSLSHKFSLSLTLLVSHTHSLFLKHTHTHTHTRSLSVYTTNKCQHCTPHSQTLYLNRIHKYTHYFFCKFLSIHLYFGNLEFFSGTSFLGVTFWKLFHRMLISELLPVTYFLGELFHWRSFLNFFW